MPGALAKSDGAAKSAKDELRAALRQCTPRQRVFLRALPEYSYQIWGRILPELKFHRKSVHDWMHKPHFRLAVELLREQHMDEIEATPGYVIERTKQVIEDALTVQPAVVTEIAKGDERKTVTEYFRRDRRAALRGLDMLGKYNRLWTEAAVEAGPRVGPGFTVIVQQVVRQGSYGITPEDRVIESQAEPARQPPGIVPVIPLPPTR